MGVRSLLLAMPDVISAFNLVTRLPNLGISSIAGNIDEKLCQVKTADLTAVKGDIQSFVRDLIVSHKPDLVGLSSMSFQHHSAISIAKLVKSINNDTLVALGGYHPTIAYRELAENPEVQTYIDFMVRGEGEETFNELIQAINGNRNMGSVDGLSYNYRGKFRHNKSRAPVELDRIKLPNRQARIIRNGFHLFGRRADVLETSRGCTMDCSFCCITQMYSRSFRKYSIERILSDIETLRAGGIQSLLFVDDNITLDTDRLEEICDAIIQRGYNDLHYFVQASVSGIAFRKDLARKMAQAGFKCVFLGIETTSEKNTRLLDIGRKLRGTDNVVTAVRLLKENDIIVFGGLISGTPDDQEGDFRETLRVARELDLDIPVFYLLTPYPGTRLRDEALRLGLAGEAGGGWSSYDCFHPFRTKSLSAEEVGFLHWKMCEDWLDHWRWLVYNKVKKHYPLYCLKMLARVWPRHLWKRLVCSLGIKSAHDLYLEETAGGKTQYSVMRRVG